MTAKKRLLFFDVITHFGGAQRSTVLLCERLRAHYDVHILDAYGVCERYLEAVQAIGVPYEVVLPSARHTYIGHKGNPARRLVKAAGQIPEMWTLKTALRKAIDRLGPDLVWTNSPKALFFLKLAGVRRICPVVFYARGWYQRQQVSPLGRWLIGHTTDAVFTVSAATAEAMKVWLGRPEMLHVVYNTIDAEGIYEAADRVLEPMPKGIERAFKILVPAHLLPTKGQHTAIEAAAVLKQKGIDFVLWLAGDTGTLDTKNQYYDTLNSLVNRYGLEDHVAFLGYRSDVAALMKAADVVVLPTHSEGLPRVVLESMLLKTPVVATPAGGTTDLIIDGQTGFLVPFEDGATLAERIERLYRDNELAGRMAEAGYQRVMERFHPDIQVPLICDEFEKILSARFTTPLRPTGGRGFLGQDKNKDDLMGYKLGMFTDGKYYQDQSGHYFTQSNWRQRLLAEYAKHFEEIRLFCRFSVTTEIDDLSKDIIDIPNLRIVGLPNFKGFRGFLRARQQIIQILRAEMSGLDVCFLRLPSQISTVGIKVAKAMGIPTVCQIVGDSEEVFRVDETIFSNSFVRYIVSKTTYYLQRRNINSTDFQTSISRQLAEKYCRYPDKVEIIPDTLIGGDCFMPYRGRRPDEVFNALYVGRVEHHKNPQLFLYALAELRRRGKPVRTTIVGGGTYLPALKSLAENLGISNAVDFVGHVRSASRLMEYYRSAHMLYLLSFTEGLGMVLLEAGAACLPIVASRVGGIPELAHDGENAFLISPDNLHECVSATEKLIDDEALREKMGRKSQEMMEKYTIDKISAKAAKTLKAAINSSKKA